MNYNRMIRLQNFINRTYLTKTSFDVSRRKMRDTYSERELDNLENHIRSFMTKSDQFENDQNIENLKRNMKTLQDLLFFSQYSYYR